MIDGKLKQLKSLEWHSIEQQKIEWNKWIYNQVIEYLMKHRAFKTWHMGGDFIHFYWKYRNTHFVISQLLIAFLFHLPVLVLGFWMVGAQGRYRGLPSIVSQRSAFVTGNKLEFGPISGSGNSSTPEKHQKFLIHPLNV